MSDEQQISEIRARAEAGAANRTATPCAPPGTASRGTQLADDALWLLERLAAAEAARAALREALTNSTRELEVWHESNPCPETLKPMCVSCGCIEEGHRALATRGDRRDGEDHSS